MPFGILVERLVRFKLLFEVKSFLPFVDDEGLRRLFGWIEAFGLFVRLVLVEGPSSSGSFGEGVVIVVGVLLGNSGALVVVVFLIILDVFPHSTLLEEHFVEVLREILRAMGVDQDFFCLVVFGVFVGRIDLVFVVLILPVGDPHAGDDPDQSDENHVDGSDETWTLGGVVLEFVADDTPTSNCQAWGQNRGVEDVVQREKFRDSLQFVGEMSGVEEVAEEELEEFVREEETED